MGWFDRLKNLLEVNFNVNIGNETNININCEGDNPPVSVSAEEDTVDVDVRSLDDDIREEFIPEIKRGYEDTGEILNEDTYIEKEAIEEANVSRIQDTLDFFRQKISRRQFKMLEAALYLRETIEDDAHVSREKIQKRKRDIAEKHGQEAYFISNLCAAGYFDEGRYFRELYHETRGSEDWREGDYQEVFEEIVQNEPFTVFVSSFDTIGEVKSRVRNKLRKYQKYGVEVRFVDVRGIGQQNRETVEEAIQELESEIEGFEYNRSIQDREIVVRIDPTSVSEFEDNS